MKKIIIILMIMLLPMSAAAQFYVTGDDPGRLKWYSMDTDNFRIIYPEGNDSLARVYGTNLEKYRIPVSRTSGYLPGGPGKLRMPVVLHTYNTSNGSVAWAPKRMDLFTIPSAYDPEPIPWEQMLAVHESRHVSQMQFGMTGAMKPFNWFFGEMFNILVSILYPNISTIEGDAVITETAYSNSGRGRTSDFLNYYRVAFDNGVSRTWHQWRFPSQKNYSPSYYALGYMTIGGTRYLYDFPDFMDKAYHLVAQKPYKLIGFRSLQKEAAGKKKFRDVFEEITDSMAVIWKEEADARAPYIAMEAVTEEARLYTDYTSNIFIGNDLYSIKKGHEHSPSIVRISSDGEHKISDFSSQAGKIKFHGTRIYWSENLPDERWSMQTKSKIRFMKGSISNEGKPIWSGNRNLSDGNRLLYNPTPSEDGKLLSCVEYLIQGGSALVICGSSEDDSEIVARSAAPEGLQLVETAWIADQVYATGISEKGYGIYRVGRMDADGKFEALWEEALGAEPVMIKDFASHSGELIFTCDRTGVNELYHFDPQSSILVQKTSIRHGGESFAYSPDGEWLYFSSQTVKGKQIFRSPVSELLDRKADFGQKHEYVLAEALTRQEEEIARKESAYTECKPAEKDFSGNFSEPERYRKFPHMFNVHSWAPVYVNVDNIMNMSFDYIYEAASLGATGIIQNRLSTATGEFGYSAHKDPYDPSKWRHSGHARLTYTGLYPALEAAIDFNDRAALQYNVHGYLLDNGSSISLKSRLLDTPSVQARFKAYLPLNFSSGGWYKGLIPQLSYTISNDFMNNSLIVSSMRQEEGYSEDMGPVFMGVNQKGNHLMQYLSGSIRAYTMLGTSNSCVYPRWGVGLEVGGWANLNAPEYFSPMAYAYAYAYLPGIMRTQGIKLSTSFQGKTSSEAIFGQRIVNILPRGFEKEAAMASGLSTRAGAMMKFTADYAIPIYIGDLSILSNLLYIKRMVITPHFDCTLIDPFNRKSSVAGSVWSAGGSLTFNLESVAFIAWPCSAGVTASVNGGSSFEKYKEAYDPGRWYVGPVFSVTF